MGETKYHYRARKMNGQLIAGELMATSADEANAQVTQLGLIPVSVTTWSGPALSDIKNFSLNEFLKRRRRVPPKDLMNFTQQLQTLYSVGVPIVEGLNLIADQTTNPEMHVVVMGLIAEVSEGKPLSGAMVRYPEAFDSIYLSMVAVGEASGNLEEILARLAEVIESQMEYRAKVKAAIFYPKMVFGMIFLVILVMVGFVIPKLKVFYESMDAGQLPLPTRIVLGASDLFLGNFFLIALLVAGGVFAFKRWVGTPNGRMLWDRAKLKMPIVGQLIIEIEMNSFCIILAMLVKSGLGIVQAFEVIKGTVSSRPIQEDVEKCRLHVLAGGRIGESLKASETFPRMLSGLIAIGEETGAIEKVLDHSSRFYKRQIDYKLNTISKAIEPFLLAVTFSFVLLLALAIMLPIWNLSSAIKR